MQEITLGSLFDGIGGFPYAASLYGIRPLWASEIVPSCVSVTKKFFPDMAHVGDVTRLDGAKLPPVDIFTFGDVTSWVEQNCPLWTSLHLEVLARGYHWRASAGDWRTSGAVFF